MMRCLDELKVGGIKTTAPFHKELLRHTDFNDGNIDTTFVERTFLD